jgi:hypothetical protein
MVSSWQIRSADTYVSAGLNPAEIFNGVQALASRSDGSLWVGLVQSGKGGGLQQLVHGAWKPFVTPELDGSTLEVTALLLDRDSSLWVGTLDRGIYRIQGDKVDHLVHREPFVVAVPRSHQLAFSKQFRLKQLGNEPFVMYERRFAPGFHDQIMGILSRAGIVPEVTQTAGEMPNRCLDSKVWLRICSRRTNSSGKLSLRNARTVRRVGVLSLSLLLIIQQFGFFVFLFRMTSWRMNKRILVSFI